MDLIPQNTDQSCWTLNPTPEEAKAFQYMSRTTGYTVQGLMLNHLQTIMAHPLDFLEGCDVNVLEPYKFDKDAPTDLDVEADSHYSFFGGRLKGCLALIDRYLDVVFGYIYRKPMPTSEIVFTIPEINALCKDAGGQWERKSVGNAVRDLLKYVAQQTDWITVTVNKRHEYVFRASPRLIEHIESNGKFDRAQLDRYSKVYANKSAEEILGVVEEHSMAQEGVSEPSVDDIATEDEDDFDTASIVAEYLEFLTDMNRRVQAIGDKYPIENLDATLYAKTALEKALTYMVENEFSKTYGDLSRYLIDEIRGDIYAEGEREFTESDNREFAATVTTQVQMNMLTFGIVADGITPVEPIRLNPLTEELKQDAIDSLPRLEEKIKTKHRKLNQIHDSVLAKFGLRMNVILA